MGRSWMKLSRCWRTHISYGIAGITPIWFLQEQSTRVNRVSLTNILKKIKKESLICFLCSVVLRILEQRRTDLIICIVNQLQPAVLASLWRLPIAASEYIQHPKTMFKEKVSQQNAHLQPYKDRRRTRVINTRATYSGGLGFGWRPGNRV